MKFFSLEHKNEISQAFETLESLSVSDKSISQKSSPQFQKFNNSKSLIKRPKTFNLLSINANLINETQEQQSHPAKQQLEDKYNLCEQIGSGHQSFCIKLEDKLTKKLFAAKIAHSSQSDEEFLSSLKQEFKILSQLNHPNLIKIYENYESSNEFIQVMEFSKHKSLQKKLITQKFQEEDIIIISYQLLKTVEYLHSQRIIHRDINLSNILYSQKHKFIKLLDFGVAKCQFSEAVFNLSSAGNKKFQAPEMFQCENYSEKIDIWGIGLILYSLLHSRIIGTKLFIKNQIDFKDCSANFQELLTNLLMIDQNQRISASDALKLSIFQNLTN